MKLAWTAIGLCLVVALTGCNTGEVSQDEMEQVRQEMSRETYEEAMIEAGRGAELEAEKAEAARRAQDDYGG